MQGINAAFDDAYRTHRIEIGDDPSTLPNPYSRPCLTRNVATTSNSANGDGFLPDTAEISSGGFMLEDDAPGNNGGGGGFILDDDHETGGGFIPSSDDDQEEHNQASSSHPKNLSNPTTIPLSAIPEALTNLGVDATDASVLSLFAETAYTPSSSRRRLAPGQKAEKVVGRVEFQQVASILLDQMQQASSSSSSKTETRSRDAGRSRPKRKAAVESRAKAAEIMDDEQNDAGAGEGGGGFIVDDVDNSEDDFEASSILGKRRANVEAFDTGSDLSSQDEDEFDVDSAIRDSGNRRRRRGADVRTFASPSLSVSPSPSEESTPKRQRRNRKASSLTSSSSSTIRTTTHLNPLQRSNASTLFQLLLDHLSSSSSSSTTTMKLPITQRRIGPNELTHIVASIGEKIPLNEIREMIDEAAKLFMPASFRADEDDDVDEEGENRGATMGQRKSAEAIRGAAAAQGISSSASVGLDEFAGVLVHNLLI
ncbi:uncharacterized protein MEPE_01084 [Melanopsichium pennsylvanicum]|uniref:Uncharacterized protein n=2 Tax=Melanopsichium pennsylvanicum TaxID=63383 RepID=A0AAJ5C3C3_9BASI|nr:putative protein [Melanopsichium pennsylvanicum 4]SNX82378.1 uncharacterized protein MEPE_01084 [Melanopsichium pennsylvanicum]